MSSARPTAARPGSGSWATTSGSAPPTSPSTRAIPTGSTPPPGSGIATWPPTWGAARARRCIAASTAAAAGRSSPAGSPRAAWARSAWPSRRRTRTSSTPPSSSTGARARCIDRATGAPPGRSAPTRSRAAPGRTTTRSSTPRPTGSTASTSPTSASRSPRTAARRFRRMQEESKHSDNHAMAFRADDPDYLLVGTDGGLYESFDLAENWRFMANLPVTQFYKVAVDDAEPFYNVYGGTQDNATQGGPSRTDNVHGIQNSDWGDHPRLGRPPAGDRARQSRHRLRRAPGGASCRGSTAPPARSSTSSPSPARERARSASTGTPRSWSAPTSRRASTSPRTGCGAATTGATAGRRSPAT